MSLDADALRPCRAGRSAGPGTPDVGQRTPALVGYCGPFCRDCSHYGAGLRETWHLREDALRRGLPIDGYVCWGCRGADLYEHPGCAQCRIRACAVSLGRAHGGECPHEPCALLHALQNDGRPHHRGILDRLGALPRLGPSAWVGGQVRRWSYACGGYSWYDTRCSRCGRKLSSFGPNPRTAGVA